MALYKNEKKMTIYFQILFQIITLKRMTVKNFCEADGLPVLVNGGPGNVVFQL